MAQMAEIMKKGLNMSEAEVERLKNYLDSHPKVAFYNEGIKWIQLYQIVKRAKDQDNNLVRNTV